jgi:hypothetical protein
MVTRKAAVPIFAALAAILVACAMRASTADPIQKKEPAMEHPTFYRTLDIDGLSIFYREAGPKDAPALLLLHGLPSSSRRIIRGSGTAIGRTRKNSPTGSIAAPRS